MLKNVYLNVNHKGANPYGRLDLQCAYVCGASTSVLEKVIIVINWTFYLPICID